MFLSLLYFPSLVESIVTVSLAVTWISPVVIVSVSPDITRISNVAMFGLAMFMLLTIETVVLYDSDSGTDPTFQDGGYAGGIIWIGELSVFLFSMSFVREGHPDMQELGSNIIGWFVP
ncbi:hypothetical protein EDB19DRAFT_1767660 [Suillus lakei]|nr:hypothetical protein EDB19DRAFT_1767660 [Suillus lakei]